MKVIFLDFDGVITTPPKWKLNERNIRWVKRIIDETGAKIVVSSSWRHGLQRSLSNAIKDSDGNEMLVWLRDNILDITPNIGLGGGRGGEIQKWLNNHTDVDNYVIIDDDSDMLDSQLYHFIQTNYEYGIGEFECISAIKVLNRLYVDNWLGLNFVLRDAWNKKCEGSPGHLEKLAKYNDLEKNYKIRYTEPGVV